MTSPASRTRTRNSARPPRDHVDLAGELTRPVDGDQRFAGAGQPDDLDLAGGHDEERHDVIAGLDEHLALMNRARMSVRGDPLDLRRRQDRKQMVGPRRRDR